MSALDRAGVEPELRDQRTARELRAQRLRRRLAEPAIDRDLEAALRPMGEADARARGCSSWRIRRLSRSGPILFAGGRPSPNSTRSRARNGTRTSRLCAIESLVGLHEQVVEQHRLEVDVLQALHRIEAQLARRREQGLVALHRAVVARRRPARAARRR